MTNEAVQTAKKVLICIALTASLSGCAGTIIAGLTFSQLLTAGSITSSLITGKGLGEHALDVVTGQDCRILEAVFRKDRAVCEPNESIATKEDFKGLIALLDTPAGQHIQLADLPIGKAQLPLVNVNIKANSKNILADLIRQPIQISSQPVSYKAAKLAHLTKATKNYEPPNIRESTIASSDLRARLVRKNLF